MAQHRRLATRWSSLRGVATLSLGFITALTTTVLIGTTGPSLATASTAVATPPAPPAVPHPFNKLTCSLQTYGIRLCKGGQQGTTDLRIPSFDGVPLDADLALPATGQGPFPLIVLLHGLGGSKADYEVTANDGGIDDVTLADKGYAVLMYTARGFGDSCGTAASRANTPACAKGFIQLADQRYEIRDTQYLAGELVDEGLVKPTIAAAGVSYGGGQSLELATLKNRMRLPNGRYVPFTSPVRHIPMSVGAVYAMWPWDDLATALVPNGHLSTTSYTPPIANLIPGGVPKESWNTLLYGVAADYYLAPRGTAPQADLTRWYHQLLAGSPFTKLDTQALYDVQTYKSAIGIPLASGGPAPTAIQSGWTDTLFPVSEALHYSTRLKAAGLHTPLLMMFDDVGHGWAQNKQADVQDTNARGIAFLDSIMLSHTSPSTGVVTLAQTCPSTAPSGSPVTGTSLQALQHGAITLNGPGVRTVTSTGGDPATAAALDPAYSSKLCDWLPASREVGTASYGVPVGSQSKELLGAVTVNAHLAIRGNYPQVVARLWDVAPDHTRQIVAMGVYRPVVNQRAGTATRALGVENVRFELNPNNYTFPAGDTIQLELVGSNAPYFLRSNGTFTIRVSRLKASIPLGQ
jgi:pimeloyl-ACP methyl ester carboxylesterase